MGNKPVAQALETVLADTFAVYLKTLNYHWNVEGANFRALHLLFEEQYTELAAAVDEIAERIRTLDEKAPAGFAAYARLSSIEDGDETADAEAMLKDLGAAQEAVIKSLNTALNAAQIADDEGTVALLDDRLRAHQKAAWMLRSSAA